jgi:hypothetical protein
VEFKTVPLFLVFGTCLLYVFLLHSILFAQAQVQPQLPLKPIIGVKITSPIAGQETPVGELNITGTSTDNPTTDCTVYADWNNLKPFQKAIATGPGGVNDYSTWSFTYTDKYHLITNGTNELTSKLTCISNPTNLTKWNSITVTGVVYYQNQQQQPEPIIANSTTLDNSTILGNGTAKTTSTTAALAVGGENEDVRDVLPMPIVKEESVIADYIKSSRNGTLGVASTPLSSEAQSPILSERESELERHKDGIEDKGQDDKVKEVSAKVEDKGQDDKVKEVSAKVEDKGQDDKVKEVSAKVEDKGQDDNVKEVSAKVEDKGQDDNVKEVSAKVEDKVKEVYNGVPFKLPFS